MLKIDDENSDDCNADQISGESCDDENRPLETV